MEFLFMTRVAHAYFCAEFELLTKFFNFSIRSVN
jgi:hypothetical protein